MAKVSSYQGNFNAGVLTPLMFGRVDVDKYKSGLGYGLNVVPLIQGGLTRRPGTYFVKEVKNSANTTIVVKFEFSTTQAYILEFGDRYFRVYMNHAQVLSGAAAVEVTTPYTSAELFDMRFVQSADVLYVGHPSHPPAKISRTSHTAWTYSVISFKDGPYLPENSTGTTLTCSANSGNVVVTASSTTGINGGAGFASTDVGRLIRIENSTPSWTWLKITQVDSPTQVRADVQESEVLTGSNTTWRLGMYSATDGYPAAVGFYQDRLTWGGSGASPQSIQFSVTGDYENHAPSASNGTVADDNAINITLNSGDVQNIRWMSPSSRGFLVGTVSGEWLIQPSSTTSGFSPTNVKADENSHHGSKGIQAIRVDKATLFVQRAGRKVRELAYVYADDSYVAPDMTVLSQQITLGGITAMAYQQEPHSILWCARSDGQLLSFVYNREQNVLGWTPHQLGGVSDAVGSPAIVESVAVIPAPDGTYDELWLVVKRYINGMTKRYVEYMTKFWEHGDDQSDAVYSDAALLYSGSAVTSVSGADHLDGEAAQILADGATHASKTVSAGQVTLDRSASKVSLGLAYDSEGTTLRDNSGSANGTAQGKTQRTNSLVARVHDTLGFQWGPSLSDLYEVPVNDDGIGTYVPLFTGDLGDRFEGDYTGDNTISFRFSGPFPGTLLAFMPQTETQDDGRARQ